jgi:hypothetical protein
MIDRNWMSWALVILTLVFSEALPVGAEPSPAAAKAEGWWPGRAQFKPSRGVFHETLSGQQTYVYDATDANLLPVAEVASATAAKAQTYADGAQFVALPGSTSLFWALGNIQPGKYWLGIQISSGDQKHPEVAEGNWYFKVRINGLCVDFSSMDGSVLLDHERYVSEMKTAEAIDLKPGDRISMSDSGKPLALVGKLILCKNPPKPGPVFRVPGYLTAGRYEKWDSRMEISAKKAGEKGALDYWVRDTASVPLKLEVELRVADYFGKIIATRTDSFALEDLASYKSSLAFDTGEAPRYRATMTIRAPAAWKR